MKKNSAIGGTWDELQKEIFTPEEIAASNLRAALIGEADEDLKELCEKQSGSEPEEDTDLIDEIADSELLAIAEDRLKNYDPAALISGEEMNRRLGITEEDLAGFEEVEIE